MPRHNDNINWGSEYTFLLPEKLPQTSLDLITDYRLLTYALGDSQT
jgi:hypothetical protein